MCGSEKAMVTTMLECLVAAAVVECCVAVKAALCV